MQYGDIVAENSLYTCVACEDQAGAFLVGRCPERLAVVCATCAFQYESIFIHPFIHEDIVNWASRPPYNCFHLDRRVYNLRGDRLEAMGELMEWSLAQDQIEAWAERAMDI